MRYEKQKKTKMQKNIDLSKLKIYKTYNTENDYFGQYNDCEHYFRLNADNSAWDIIQYESTRWDSLDQRIWKEQDIEFIEHEFELPGWLPPLPSLDEVKSVPYVDWTDELKGKGAYPADEFPHLKKYFQNNKLTEKVLFFALKEDSYESIHGDGIFRYVAKVSFDAEAIREYIDSLLSETENSFGMIGFFKKHSIRYDGQNFDMPDFEPQTFEHYTLEKLLFHINESLNI